MRPYEVMIIFDPSVDDDVIRAELDRSTQLIRSRGGNPGRVERWGRRRLAYEIRKQSDGYYVLLEATAEPTVMAELDRTLALADPVLRHKVIRIPDKPMIRPTRGGATGESTSPQAPEPDLAASAADRPS